MRTIYHVWLNIKKLNGMLTSSSDIRYKELMIGRIDQRSFEIINNSLENVNVIDRTVKR